MKKLIAMAAFAATASAFAACALPGTNPTCQLPVWDFQMMLRADTRCMDIGYIGANDAHCGLGGNAEICGCYREIQTLSYAGVWYICDCGCDKLTGAGISVEMADMTRRIKYSNVVAGAKAGGLVTFSQLYRIGAYAEKCAALADLQFGDACKLQLAGFGAVPLTAEYFQTLAGFATGLIDASPSCNPAQAPVYCGTYDFCAPGVDRANPQTWPAMTDTATAVAYGQFQAKFNAAASARLAATLDSATGDYNVAAILPTWFVR